MELSILEERFPRAFYFRATESVEHYDGYAEWAAEFDRLQGVQGKALAEEKSDRTLKHIRAYTRFKREHPRKMVLLHFNGNARDPGYQTDEFFAGHWLYTNGATILCDVPAGHYGACELEVSDVDLFTLYTGRFFDRGEDIGLCDLDADGRPDWRRCEQVQLVDIDRERSTITVRRACHGTRPIGFRAGRAYAAAHVIEGPWNGRQNNLMWFYNYSTHCPRDEQGRTCGDVLAEWLVRTFGPEGPLAEYDGLEFDVLFSSLHNHPYYYLQDIGPDKKKQPDCNADGIADMGVFDGVDTYGVGVVAMCRRLREQMGEERLILADAGWWHGQRSFGLLNGIESEGLEVDEEGHAQWGHMLNTHLYWNAQARKPALSYFMMARRQKHMTDGAWRIGMAAAVLSGSAISVNTRPNAPAGDRPNDWDEIVKGREGQVGWLGRPLGPVVRLALSGEDLLGGLGDPPQADLLDRLTLENAEAEMQADALLLRGCQPVRRMGMHMRGIEPGGPDLVVALRARGEPMSDYPREGRRLVFLTAMQGGEPVVRMSHKWGTRVRRHGYFLDDDFLNVFVYNDLPAGELSLCFEFEGFEPVRVDELRLIAQPDACYREFEHGVVLVNPSKAPYTFRLASLFPGRRLRRLHGHPEQYPEINTGEPVGEEVTLPVHDALFLAEA